MILPLYVYLARWDVRESTVNRLDHCSRMQRERERFPGLYTHKMVTKTVEESSAVFSAQHLLCYCVLLLLPLNERLVAPQLGQLGLHLGVC